MAALAALLLTGGSDASIAPDGSRALDAGPTLAATHHHPGVATPTRRATPAGVATPTRRATPAGAAAATVPDTPEAQAVEARDPPDPMATARGSDAAGSSDPATTAQTGRITSAEPERRRRYRRRYRNRYPGPIPTPADWEPPEGPVRIGLQAGHWRAQEAPAELSGLRDNGTRWNHVAEWEANLGIARRAAAMLEEAGYAVDVLPAVVPPGYRAHLFIAIHADGSGDPRATGYRVASPRRDATGRADGIASLLQKSYGEATGIRHLTSATRRMRNYYAFNFRRYEHALHPMTIAVILETGFLTSARDRTVILDDPDRAARGIVEAVRAFPVTALPQVAAETSAEPGLTSSRPSDPGRPGARPPGS